MAKISTNNTEFEITNSDTGLLLNGEPVKHTIIQLPNGSYSLILDNNTYAIEVLNKNTSTGQVTLTINGRIIKSTLQNKLAELLKSMGMEAGKRKLKELKAPMPGLVLDVLVQNNAEVLEGQDLLVLEAMKMENTIKSPQDGIIESISVQNQDKVDKNQVLVTFQ